MKFLKEIAAALSGTTPTLPEPTPASVAPPPVPVPPQPAAQVVVEEEVPPPPAPEPSTQEPRPNGDGRKPRHHRHHRGKPAQFGGLIPGFTLADLKKAREDSEQATVAKKTADAQAKAAEDEAWKFQADGVKAGKEIRALIEAEKKGEARELTVRTILELLPRAFALEEDYRENAVLGILDLVELRGLHFITETEDMLVELFGGEEKLPGWVVEVLVGLYQKKRDRLLA